MAGDESDGGGVTPEEFERVWIPVAQAFATLKDHWADYICRETIFQHLKLGKLVARAEAIIIKDRGEVPFGVIEPALWTTEPPDYDAFWQTGIYETLVQDSRAYYNRREVTCFKVRFDPAGFARMLPQAVTADHPNSAPTRAPSFKRGRGPSDDEILAKADEMRVRGLNTFAIAKMMRLESGFENVANRVVRELVRGRYPRVGRAGMKKE